MKGTGTNENLSTGRKVNIEQSITLMLVIYNREKLISNKTAVIKVVETCQPTYNF